VKIRKSVEAELELASVTNYQLNSKKKSDWRERNPLHDCTV